jgi:hypothetical protein
MITETYAQRSARLEPIAKQLESIAYRLRQGAISEELAAQKLHAIADSSWLKGTA